MGCEDSFWQTALEVEEALLTGAPLHGMSLDLTKAFDRVPQQHLFALAEGAGLNAQFLGALKGMDGQLERRFKLNGLAGREFTSTNGIMQGCPLSIVLLNLLMSVCKHDRV